MIHTRSSDYFVRLQVLVAVIYRCFVMSCRAFWQTDSRVSEEPAVFICSVCHSAVLTMEAAGASDVMVSLYTYASSHMSEDCDDRK